MLEELVKNNSKDDEMLVALAACLVEHASTLADPDVAGKERLRARDLLEKAWALGNTSTLAMNLSQLLKQLPENGAIKFSDDPRAEHFMEAGEAAFSRRDFDEAVKNYGKALELDPKNYSAALFTANTYDKQNQYAKAAEWYQRAIDLDPDIETAYRYNADMLARQGDMDKSRTMLIQATVAEPYNQIVWRELHAWAMLNNTQIKEVLVAIPISTKEAEAAGIKLSPQPPEVASAWQAYRDVRKKWQEEEFKKHFPQEDEYRHSLPEESDALMNAARKFEPLRANNNTKEAVANDPTVTLLLKLYETGLVEPYVLFSLGDSGIARDYAAYRAQNRKKLEEYMDRFVVPPVLPPIRIAR